MRRSTGIGLVITAGFIGGFLIVASAVSSKNADAAEAQGLAQANADRASHDHLRANYQAPAVQAPAVQAPAVQAPAVQAPAVQRAPQAGDTVGRGGASEVQIVSLDNNTGYAVLTVRNVSGRNLSWVRFDYNIFDSTGVLTDSSTFLWANGIPADITAKDEGFKRIRNGDTVKLTNVTIR